MKQTLFFVDAETDGLYGSFLTAAVLVADRSTMQELERAYYGIRRENMRITDPWVREHVQPVLGAYESCESEEALLERVWELWQKYAGDAYAVADVAFPVECRLFQRCVERNPAKRTFSAPFPLLDLSSILLAKGIDPLMERRKILASEEEVRRHNALSDVEVSWKLWKKVVENKG